MNQARIGLLVDVQTDFVRPDGRLYVRDPQDPEDPGATEIIPTLTALARWMNRNCDLVLYTADWHTEGDREIEAEAPDFQTTFPPHCMGGSNDPGLRPGADIIAEVAPTNPVVVNRDASPEEGEARAREAVETGRPAVLRKSEFSLWEGCRAAPAFFEAVREALGGSGDAPLEVVTGGVARDVCVRFAVEGLPEGFEPTVVADATWGLGLEPAMTLYKRWGRQGRVIQSEDLENAPVP